ncbi:MAG: alpha/beta fold hydrolase [Chloroflexi bacterium]|nr:alpha/beta fold hydrolase [Chloroflexota bacterium]
MPKTTLNGIGIYYEVHGKGFPVLFTHGFAGGTWVWHPQIPVLSEKYQLIIWDARGHGQSDSPPAESQYSADILVGDVYHLLQHLNIKKAVIGGLSMGGYLSLRFYMQHPEMVTALVLMDTGPGYRNPDHMAEWNRELGRRASLLETKGIAAFADDPSTVMLNTYTPRHQMLRQNPVGLAHMARQVVGQHDTLVHASLTGVKVPTLVLVGDRDTPFLKSSEYMARTIAGAEHIVIPNAGHASNIDNAPVFNQSVLSFLGRHVPS